MRPLDKQRAVRNRALHGCGEYTRLRCEIRGMFSFLIANHMTSTHRMCSNNDTHAPHCPISEEQRSTRTARAPRGTCLSCASVRAPGYQHQAESSLMGVSPPRSSMGGGAPLCRRNPISESCGANAHCGPCSWHVPTARSAHVPQISNDAPAMTASLRRERM